MGEAPDAPDGPQRDDEPPAVSHGTLEYIDAVVSAPVRMSPGREPACHIRRATDRDAGQAWAVEQAAFAESDRFSLRQTRGLIANPRGRVFVAEAGGDIVAWTAMLIRRTRAGASGRLYTIAVSPGWAGRGLGRRLAAHGIESLTREGIRRIYLEVRAENDRAIALYESMGFRVVRHLPTYYGEASPGLRMLLDTGRE
jgi:ribosomal-protein-alanine N-acetyltransferase